MECHTICSFVPSLAVSLDLTGKLSLQNFNHKRSLISVIKPKLVYLCFRTNHLKTGSKCISNSFSLLKFKWRLFMFFALQFKFKLI